MSNLTVSNHWVDVAEDRAESMHNPKMGLGLGLVGGLVFGALLNPMTAFASIAWGLYAAWDENEKNSDQVEAVEDGIIAHVLDKRLLRQYILAVGVEQVKEELTEAIARELKLSPPAEELAQRWELRSKKKAPQSSEEPEPEPEPTEEETSEPVFTLPFGWQVPDLRQVWPRSQEQRETQPINEPVSDDLLMPETELENSGVTAVSVVSESGSEAETTTVSADGVNPISLMARTPFETVGAIQTDEFQLFRILKDEKRKQTDIIQILYHVSAGGTEAYRRARERYMQLLKEYLNTRND